MPDLEHLNAERQQETQQLRMPPHSQEAEQSVLGGLMLDNSCWEELADVLVEEDFYHKENRLIFRALNALGEQNSPSGWQ